MDEAGAGLGGDEIAEQQRRVLVVAAPAQRMRADRAGQLRALQHVQHVMRGDAGVLPATAAAAASATSSLLALARQRARPRCRRHGPARSRTPRPAAMARLPGMVQGVVVQITTAAPASSGHAAPGPPGSAPRSCVQVWSWYSTSASASAVFSTGDHITGRRPRIQRAVQQELADLAGDRRLGGEVHRGVALRPVALDAQAAELLLLHAHPVRRHRRGTRRGTASTGTASLSLARRRGTPPRSSIRSAGRGSPSPGCSWRRSRPSGGCG